MNCLLLTDDPELIHAGPLRSVRLSPTDVDLLRLLARQTVVSPEAIFRTLFEERLIEPGAVYSRISRLRRELGFDLARCVRSRGYLLAPSVVVAVPLSIECGVP